MGSARSRSASRTTASRSSCSSTTTRCSVCREAWVGFGIMLALVADALARSARRVSLGPPALALGPAASVHVRGGDPGRDLLLLSLESAGRTLAGRRSSSTSSARDPRAAFLTPSTRSPARRSRRSSPTTTTSAPPILGFRFFFGWWGGLTMAVLAYAVFLQPDASTRSACSTPTATALRHRRRR